MNALENTGSATPWPELPTFAEWEPTHTTLHMWIQIVGKTRMALSPNINHYWGTTLYVTPRGLTTSSIPFPSGSFAIDFDFIAQKLLVSTSQGLQRDFALEPITVAEFYTKIRSTLSAVGVSVHIYGRPVEVVESIPFAQDPELREFILPYAAIRKDNPRKALLSFLQSTYEGAATLANWDRAALERGTK